jgi:hypothetical protein
MSGRRRYPRYAISNCVGTVRVVSDVTVQEDARGDLIAISDQPRTCGEMLTIELMNGALVRTPVCVAETRPIVENGSIWHWLRLVPRELDCGSMTADRAGAPPLVETDEPSL